MPNLQMVEITNDVRQLLIDPAPEPPLGSVVMLHGLAGTAWQRLSDGDWYSTRGGTPRRWSQLIRRDRVVLILEGQGF